MPNMEVIADNIRFWIENNAEGIMTQGSYQSPGSERDEMRSWVIAKLMWDPRLDLDALVNDFIYGHYGKAAPAIAEYDRLLRQAGSDHAKGLAAPKGGIRFKMDDPFLSREFLDRATDLFKRAATLAENDTIRRRVEQAEMAILYVKLMRGPAFVGAEYPAVVERFERIARAVGVTHTREGGPDMDERIASFRKRP